VGVPEAPFQNHLNRFQFRPLERKRTEKIGMWFVGWNVVAAISNPLQGFDEPQPMCALD
jgi:hypothetical protein